MEGLQHDIRAAVVLHRPQNLDTVVDLSCLQEEVVDAFRGDERRTPAPYSTPAGGRAIPRTAPPLPPPPTKTSDVPGDLRQDDRRTLDMARTPAGDDKLAALRAYRRAKGLCFTYGERWGRDHRCVPTVQLHVVEELIEMLHQPSPELVQAETTTTEADCCVFSPEKLWKELNRQQ